MFPTRERVALAREDELLAVGFSRRKAEYIVSLARSDLEFEALALLPDDEVRARLVAQRGLGEWTADWYLARQLARPEAWPAGDLGLRRAVGAFYRGGDDVSIESSVSIVSTPGCRSMNRSTSCITLRAWYASRATAATPIAVRCQSSW